MVNKAKQKRRMKKSFKKRKKQMVDMWWERYWIKVGILNEKVRT